MSTRGEAWQVPEYDRARGVAAGRPRGRRAGRAGHRRAAAPDADASGRGRSGRTCSSRRSSSSGRARSSRAACSRSSRRSRPRRRRAASSAISAGNHAQAVAWGAAEEGLDALARHVGRTRARRRSRRRAATARASTSRRRAPARPSSGSTRCWSETGRTLVHPFDDPLTIAGQGTVGLEILEDVPGVDTIVVPIGGGGLISGIAVAAAGRARVVGVEPELSTAMHSALAAGERVRRDADVVADGLNAPYAGEHALADRPRARRGRRARERGGDRRGLPVPLRAGEARVRAGRRRGGGCACSRARSTAGGRSASSRAGTSPRRPPLVSWPAHEGWHSSRVRPRARHVLVRQRVLDPLHEAGAPRRDLRRVPSLLHGQAEARGHRAAGSSVSSAGSRRPAAPAAARRSDTRCGARR